MRRRPKLYLPLVTTSGISHIRKDSHRAFGGLFCFGFMLLFVCAGSASAQVPAPRSYLFVEVKDTGGKPVPDAKVEVSSRGPTRDWRTSHTTDQDGVVDASFHVWSTRAYDLKVSKPGYLASEHFFFVYPAGDSRYDFVAREELPSGSEKFTSSDRPVIKVVLSKIRPPTRERNGDIEDRKRQFLLAAKRGDTPKLLSLLAIGVKPDAVDVQGVPAIVWAAFSGNDEAIKALLAAGANIRSRKTIGHQVLLVYLVEGLARDWQFRPGENQSMGEPQERRHEIMRALIEAGADVNAKTAGRGTVLNRAIGQVPKYLSIKAIRLLLASGVKVNETDEDGMTPLMWATQAHSLEAIILLIDAGAGSTVNTADKAGNTAMMYACKYAYPYANAGGEPGYILVKSLVAIGGDVGSVNHEGQNALMLASSAGAWDSVYYLRGVGARLSINAKDKKGRTALMYASEAQHSDNSMGPTITSYLIQGGAKVNEKDNEGLTALMYACKVFAAQAAETAKVLIAGGASVNERDIQGRTALMYVVEGNSERKVEGVTLLLKSGADVSVKDDKGQTALMIARKSGQEAIIKLLEQSQHQPKP